MGKNKNNRGGYGYSDSLVAAHSNVQLPNMVPCGRCEKKKGHHCYSKNRLGDLKAHVYKTPRFNAALTPHVNCMMCSGAGAQQLELDCIGCDRTLPNTHFNKTQRRTPDRALCESCQRKRLEYEPDGHSSDEDSGHGSFSDDSNDFGDDLSTMAGTFSSTSISGNSTGGVNLNSNAASSNGNGYSSTTASRAPSVANSKLDEASTTSNATNRTGWTTTTSNTNSNVLPPGFDANAYGTPPHLRNRSVAQSGSVAQSTRSDVGSSGGGKFAKVRAGDAIRRPNGRPETKAPLAPVPGAQDDDDIGVADDESDED